MKIQFQIVRYVDLDVDFQQIYDYVKAEYEADGGTVTNKWDVYDYFGNNTDYFLEHIYHFKTDDNDEINGFNDGALEYLWEEFGNWLNKQTL